jgi:anaerobic selenocysteine-containing dehydrogenase
LEHGHRRLSPQQGRLRRALRREDLFTIALDLFPTDTTDFADVVLPAASFLEFDDLVAGYFHLSLSAQAKVMEPLGEVLPNQEIFRCLSRAMEYTEPELYESDAEIIARVLRKANLGVVLTRWLPKAPCRSPQSRSSSSPI